jgi:RNA polymerase primary sigma factor
MDSLGADCIKAAAHRINRKPEYVEHLLTMGRAPVSLDRPAPGADSDADMNMGEIIPDDKNVDPVDTAFNESLKKAVHEALRTLPGREAKVLSCRYGLEDGMPMTLDEVGYRLKISKERVRQIESKAIKSMRHPLRQQQLQAYIA